jgi:hypothetical protein
MMEKKNAGNPGSASGTIGNNKRYGGIGAGF